MRPLGLGDLAVEKRDLAQPGVDRFALVGRQLELAQPRLALAAEQVAGRRTALQAAHQDGVHLVLHARARADELRAPRQSSAHRADRLVGHPHGIQRPGRQQRCQRQRVQAVGLGPRLPDPRVAGTDHHHTRDVPLEDPGDLPRVAGHLQRDTVARRQALGEQLHGLARARHPAAGAAAGRIDDRDLTEIAVDVQPNRSHPFGSPPRRPDRRTGGQTTKTYALAAQPGKSQGRPTKRRARSPSRKTGLPLCVLPRSPCPSRSTLTSAPDRPAASTPQFHAPKGGSAAVASRGARLDTAER